MKTIGEYLSLSTTINYDRVNALVSFWWYIHRLPPLHHLIYRCISTIYTLYMQMNPTKDLEMFDFLFYRLCVWWCGHFVYLIRLSNYHVRNPISLLLYNRGGVPSNQKLGDIIVNGRGNKYVYILYRIYRRLALLFVFVFVFVCLFCCIATSAPASIHPYIYVYVYIYFETSILYIIKEGW